MAGLEPKRPCELLAAGGVKQLAISHADQSLFFTSISTSTSFSLRSVRRAGSSAISSAITRADLAGSKLMLGRFFFHALFHSPVLVVACAESVRLGLTTLALGFGIHRCPEAVSSSLESLCDDGDDVLCLRD